LVAPQQKCFILSRLSTASHQSTLLAIVCADDLLAARTLLQIQVLGGVLGVSSTSSVVTVIGGSGATASTDSLFIAYSASDPFGASAIEPGGYVILRSSSTGQFCRLASISGGEGLVCDQATASGGTALLYNITSLTVNGQSLASDGYSLLLEQGDANTSEGSNLRFVSIRKCPPLKAPCQPSRNL
jgi:hypothetical protein